MHLQKDSSLQSTGRRLSLNMQQTQDDVRSCQMGCAAAPCWSKEQAPTHAITVTERVGRSVLIVRIDVLAAVLGSSRYSSHSCMRRRLSRMTFTGAIRACIATTH